MAGESPDLYATLRTGTGKGAARQARRDNLVPGIVYGGGADPVAVNLKFNELIKRLKDGRFLSTLFNLKVDGMGDTRVICRGVQRDVVRDLPVHVDFMRLRQNSRINLYIPVEFVGEDDCPGLRKGGVLTVVRQEVELKVTAADIPEKLTVDLSGLDIGDIVHISDIALPGGTRPMITDRDFVIANISAPSALAAGDDEEGEEGEEGEVPAGEEETGEDDEA